MPRHCIYEKVVYEYLRPRGEFGRRAPSVRGAGEATSLDDVGAHFAGVGSEATLVLDSNGTSWFLIQRGI
jgi:hypothetical protein